MTARLTPARHPQHRLRARLTDYTRAEDGTMMVFVMSLLIIMLMLGGMAVDLMRYEQRRTLLQQTNDRAVLAAASLTQDLDPTEVVDDHFDKAGLAQYLKAVNVSEGLNFRIVEADAEAELQPFFMQMMGIDELTVPSASTAEQRITNVEIVLVLDVSGSMSGAKIANLKTAAMEFVDTVKERDAENRISIAVVPYNAQVNLGATLRGQYNATNQHGVANVNCLEVPTSMFSSVSISRTTGIPMMAYADTSSTTPNATAGNNTYTNWTSTASSGARFDANQPFCRNTAANIVRLPAILPATIKANINALVAAGNTSITLGMKWGVALIEPGARPMYNTLINAGEIPGALSGRPFAWQDDDSMKVIVLMTDGEHVAHTRVNDIYKTGISPIWRSTADGNYSIRHTASRPVVAGANEFYVPHLDTWQAAAWNSGGGATQMNWQDVWAQQRVSWVAYQLYGRALGTTAATRTSWYNTTMTAMQSTWASVAAMNSTLQQSCTLAKNNGVVVYGIAFEAPTNGQTQILGCASSSAHFFNANGLQIQSAFRAIASNISQLRLTQ